MPKARTRANKGRGPALLRHLLSAAWTLLVVLGITVTLLVLSVGLADLTGAPQRIRYDRVLESRTISTLQAEPANYIGQTLVIQGPVQGIDWGQEFGGVPADVVVVGGLEEGDIPLRILVTGGTRGVSVSSVIHATGTGAPDPIDPARLALLAPVVTVVPIATFNVNEVATSVLAFASLFGVLMAALGVFWERNAAALRPQYHAEGAADSPLAPPQFLTALTRGRDVLSVNLRMAFLAALGRALFVFGLIAFLYVYFTVYVLAAAAVDWWVHHWVPWLRLDAFAALGLLAAFIGLFLYTFVRELTRRA